MTPERRAKLENVLAKRQPNLTVVMENVMDPHNVSAVMRSCDAVGIQDIYVISNKAPRPRKWGAKSSSSAAKWLTVHQFDSVQQCITELRKEYSTILTTHLSTEAMSLYSIDFTGSIALVFGNEHEGVSEEMRNLADGNFLIPQVGIIQSLNISVACAVSIYEAFRQKSNAGHYNQSSLQAQRKSVLMQQWGFLGEDLKL
jgi:tRNA (guanosine-2'-O-)-methyltransferase